MSTRKQTHVVELPTDPQRAFSALITPSAICQWWQAKRAIVLAEPDGFWSAAWGEDEDDPDYVCGYTIGEFRPPQVMVFKSAKYYSRHGKLPFEAEITTRFTVESTSSGSILTVEQDGFPTDPLADDFFAGCQQGWTDTLSGLQNFLAGMSRAT